MSKDLNNDSSCLFVIRAENIPVCLVNLWKEFRIIEFYHFLVSGDLCEVVSMSCWFRFAGTVF